MTDAFINHLESKFKNEDERSLLEKYKKYLPLLNDKTKKVIDIEDIYEDIGYSLKGTTKNMLVSRYTGRFTVEKIPGIKNNKEFIYIDITVFIELLKNTSYRSDKSKILYNIFTTADKYNKGSSSTDIIVNDIDITINKPVVNDKLLNLLKENFTIEEQALFVNQFIMYLKYGNDSSKYIINLDDVWKDWLGYNTKQHCKTTLENNFTLNIDYIIVNNIENYDYINQINGLVMVTQKSSGTKEAQNHEYIYLNINTFKGLCWLIHQKLSKKECIILK